MPKKYRSTVMCNYIECVADIPRDQAFKDELGTHWCTKHRVRGLLINYGVQHSFPEVIFHPYAIGNTSNDEELWKIAATLGDDAMMSAAASALGLVEETHDD